MGKVRYLVIHCTASPEEREVTSDDIRRWHLAPAPLGRGWKQVGYTDMIHLDGQIERLVENNEDDIVDLWEITNGVNGLNGISRHIVYVGGVNRQGKAADTRTCAQKCSLESYVLDFVQRFPDVKIAGHCQFANKSCPCFDVPGWCRQIGLTGKNIYP